MASRVLGCTAAAPEFGIYSKIASTNVAIAPKNVNTVDIALSSASLLGLSVVTWTVCAAVVFAAGVSDTVPTEAFLIAVVLFADMAAAVAFAGAAAAFAVMFAVTAHTAS